MIVNKNILGYKTPVFEHYLDNRWAMAYSASTKNLEATYFDDINNNPLRVHPLFPVCLEWPSLVHCFENTSLSMKSTIHGTHDLHIFKQLIPNQTYFTIAEVVGLQQIKPGTYLTWNIKTRDTNGSLVCMTWQGNIFLGGRLAKSVTSKINPPSTPGFDKKAKLEIIEISISPEIAHTYTECARIWNPIHTELSAARESGMPKPILHGTATLALSVSAVVKNSGDFSTDRISRIGCRFSSPIFPPERLILKVYRNSDTVINFELLTSKGKKALQRAYIEYR